MKVYFAAHSTTTDNQADIASGWKDVELSELGIQQSKEMAKTFESIHVDLICCSDLKRAVDTVKIAFGDKFPIIRDARLNECNYGDLTQHPSEEVDPEKPKRIKEPFPNGESYEQTTERMRSFLSDLSKNYDGKRVMIIGHRATQYGLECLINKIPLEQVIPAPWKWQPGWEYKLETI